jgi:hypothetical protein
MIISVLLFGVVFGGVGFLTIQGRAASHGSTSPEQEDEVGLKEIRERLLVLNDRLGSAKEEWLRAWEYLQEAHEEKEKLFQVKSLQKAGVYGVSISDWAIFADEFDFHVQEAKEWVIVPDWEKAIDSIDKAEETKKALEDKLPPRKTASHGGSSSEQENAAGLKEIRERLLVLNDLLGRARRYANERDVLEALKFLVEIHRQKHEELFQVKSLQKAGVYGVSVSDWAIFADEFDFHVRRAQSYAGGIDPRSWDWMVEHIDEAEKAKKAIEDKLPPKKKE